MYSYRATGPVLIGEEVFGRPRAKRIVVITSTIRRRHRHVYTPNAGRLPRHCALRKMMIMFCTLVIRSVTVRALRIFKCTLNGGKARRGTLAWKLAVY